MLVHAGRRGGPVTRQAIAGVAGLQDRQRQQRQPGFLRQRCQIDILPDCAGAGVARMELAVTLKTLIEAGTGLAPDPATAPRWKARGDRRGLSNLPLLIKRKKTD